MITGALVGAGLSLGLVLVIAGWVASRRPSLADRVMPYVRDLTPDRPPSLRVGAVAGLFVTPGVMRLARGLGETISSSTTVSRRLVRLGRTPDVNAFRVAQTQWGVGGFCLALALSLLIAATRPASVVSLLVLCAMGFVGGFVVFDQRLTWAVRRREQAMREEFPVVADLLALAVAAGESPLAAIDRVCRIGVGALTEELGIVLADVRSGVAMVAALDALSARTGVGGVARFAEALAVAIDRGTPLVDVLHAQAEDVREAGRRELIESGGRREVAMMVPVVFLILPVTIIFAFYPGLVALHLTSGG